MKMRMKLTEPQWELLDRICRSNGGGVTVGMSPGAEFNRAHALYKRGYAQGKAGQPYKAVHTPEGLKLWRQQMATV